MEKPFGYEATMLVRKVTQIGTGPLARTEVELLEKRVHRRGPASKVRYAAKLTRGMQRILSIEPYTKEQWIRVFGNGCENGSAHGWID